MNDLGTLVLAAGALGTAAFGIVEGLKWLRAVGEAGFGSITRLLGTLKLALEVAYGRDYLKLLRGHYRGDEKEFARILRQGVRVGLTTAHVPDIVGFLGSLDAKLLGDAITKAERGDELTPPERNIIGRYELAADARIDAALAVAKANYTGAARVFASIAALTIALVTAYFLSKTVTPAANNSLLFLKATLVGIAAVPLAPIAKDIASAIQSATQALRAKI